VTALVSHVLPVWNPRSEWLLPAVRSVLGQEGCELELVVVDDGSDVPAAELLGELGDDRMRVVRIDHGGVSRARNEGLAAARGNYVRFVDADDVVAPGSTARLVALAGGSEAVIPYGATTFCDEDLRPVWTMRCSVEGDAAEACLLGRFTVRIVSMLFPRTVVDAAGPFDEDFRVSSDWDYVLRALDAAPVRGSEPTLTYYRKHGGSVTGDLAGGEAAALLTVDRYFDRHPEQRRTRLERRARAGVDAMAARTLVARRSFAGGARAAWRAAVADPAALVGELRRSAPALAGHARARVSPRRPVPFAS
jgi:glycosyltransferase involved in cell wall biosynthesis